MARILGIKKTSVEVHLHTYGAKAGLKTQPNKLKKKGNKQEHMFMCPLLCPHGFLSPLSSQLIGIKKEIVISPIG